jgi:hypothetical protein
VTDPIDLDALERTIRWQGVTAVTWPNETALRLIAELRATRQERDELRQSLETPWMESAELKRVRGERDAALATVAQKDEEIARLKAALDDALGIFL